MITFSAMVYAQNSSCVTAQQTVSFQNIILNQNCMVPATYAFGLNSMIFCYTNGTTNAGIITWTFQGQPQSGNLPIFLTNNANFQGQFADSSGNINITNNQIIPIVVSCVFGY